MAPQVKVDIVVLKLTFLPFLHPLCPKMSFYCNRICPRRPMIEVRSWFNDALLKEKSKISDNLSLRFYEWDIRSGNLNLFEANGYYYDRILVILGEERVHWLFYTTGPFFKRLKGVGCVALSFCGCCLNTQYIKIIETIKDWMVK